MYLDTPTIDELIALDAEHNRYDNRLIGLFEKTILIWTDFIRINTTHFKARFAINYNRKKMKQVLTILTTICGETSKLTLCESSKRA